MRPSYDRTTKASMTTFVEVDEAFLVPRGLTEMWCFPLDSPVKEIVTFQFRVRR